MKRISQKGRGLLGTVILSFLITLICFIALTLIFTALAAATKDPLAYTAPFGLVAMAVCGGVGGFISSRLTRDYPFPHSLISGGIFLLLSLPVGLLLGGKIALGSLISRLCFLGIWLFFAFLARRVSLPIGKKRRRARR